MRASTLIACPPVNILPSPWSAGIAGVVAALAWPLMWARFGGPASAGNVELIIATLLVIALPAHVFVVGLRRSQPVVAGALDTALLERVGAWIAAAMGTTALRAVAMS